MNREEALNPEVVVRKYSTKTRVELKQFRENYKWDKVWYWRFLEMYNVCWDEERAIKRNQISIIERYPKEYEIYRSYNQPKCSFSQFMIRHRLWKSISECLKPTSWQRPWWLIVYDTHAQTIQKKYKWDNYLIEVSYSTEEALIFRNVYKRMIDELEYEILDATPSQAHEIEKKLKQLNHELEIFNIYNPE